MPYARVALLYAASLASFLVLDLAWLTATVSRFYKPRLGDLMAPQPRLGAAALFYLLYVAGVLALAVFPGLRDGSATAAIWRGALFGLVAYATYDLTNLSTLRGWPLDLTLVDMLWGAVLTGAVSAAGYAVGRWLGL